MGPAGRGTVALGVVLGVLTGFAAAGWLAPRGGEVAGVAVRRGADWRPSPVAKDWEAPVLPRAGSTPTAAAAVAPTAGPTGAAGTPAAAVNATATVARPASTATASPAQAAGAQAGARGEWHEEHLESRVLGRRMPFLIWIPPGYSASRRYPVVYMLHGGGDGQTPGRAEWLQLGMREALDQASAAGELPPAIFVFPEGLNGYWVNHANGGARWADYVTQDVVPHVDRIWSTETRPERRAIGGLSMGGLGALHLALNQPQTFRIVGAHSPALRSHKESPPFFGDEGYFARFDPMTLATRTRVPSGFRAWVDVGENDRWRVESERLAAALEKAGAKTELRLFKGRHEGEYWKAHLRDYVRFYGEALRG